MITGAEAQMHQRNAIFCISVVFYQELGIAGTHDDAGRDTVCATASRPREVQSDCIDPPNRLRA